MNKTVYILIFILWMFAHQIWAQQNYVVESLSFNTDFTNNIFAIPYEDGLIYSSDRRTHVLVSRVDSANHSLFHLFFAIRKDSAKWGVPQLLTKNIPINAHQGPFSISADGKEFFFSLNDEMGQRIYSASKSGSDWGNIRPFVHNRPNYTTTHPSLSRDGKRLFFASDIPGGYGGFDIYVCERTLTGWSAPKNLGPTINTSENELFPFIQENGELFFSSTGHGSMGGMDIFSVREIDGVWGMLHQLEAPINSTADDITYTAADAEGTIGYFASNRSGKSFDIYSFKSLFPVFNDCREQEENEYGVYEFSEMTVMGMDTATLRLEWDLGDGTIKYGDVVEHTYPSTGHYVIQLNVLDTLTNEISQNVAHYLLDVLDIEQPYITTSEIIQAGITVTFDALKTNLPDLEIEEYFWIFGDGIRTRGERVEHVYAVPGVYKVQLGVIGKSKYTGDQMRFCSYLEITVQPSDTP